MARWLLLIALPIYAAAFFYLRPDIAPQTWEGGEIAGHILAGEGYSMHRFSGVVQPSANQEPVYPLLLAAFQKSIPAPFIVLLLLQVATWLWASALLARIAERLVGAPPVATALVVALWPPMVVYVLSYHPLWLRASVLIFALAAAAEYRDGPTGLSAVRVGVALGLAMLFRSTFLALPVLVLFMILRVPRLQHGLIMLAVAAGVLSPWIIRNAVTLNAFVPGTTTAGYTALIGNHHGADGVMDRAALERGLPERTDPIWKKTEVVRDRELRAQVRGFVRTHPGEAVGLYFRKLLYMFTWRPGVGEHYRAAWTPIYLALWCVTLLLAGVGVWRAARNPMAEGPFFLLAPFVFFAFIYALFAVNMRYRFESEVLLLPYGVFAASASIRSVIAWRRSAPASESSGSSGENQSTETR